MLKGKLKVCLRRCDFILHERDMSVAMLHGSWYWLVLIIEYRVVGIGTLFFFSPFEQFQIGRESVSLEYIKRLLTHSLTHFLNRSSSLLSRVISRLCIQSKSYMHGRKKRKEKCINAQMYKTYKSPTLLKESVKSSRVESK